VAIGVTGHRILSDVAKIQAGVDKALGRIDEKFPGRRVTVISSIAEGADRLVVHRVLRRPHARLLVPLPLPQAEYLTDFATAESKGEFLALLDRADEVVQLPPAGTRERAYEAAGRYVVERCDVLLAVWDGRDAQGQGGTGGIVAEARERGLPIAWVRAGNRKPGTLEPTSLGDEQGKVTFENLPIAITE